MANNWNKKLGFSVVALYRVGNYTDAALVGAIMFERAIYHLLDLKDIDKFSIVSESSAIQKGDLEHAINRVCEKYRQYNTETLHAIRRGIRNQIIHEVNINDIKEESIKPMILFVWEVFDNNSYELFKNIESIDFLTADYSVVAMREMLNEDIQNVLERPHSFNDFSIQDFEDLSQLRIKMIALGSKIKKDILKIKYKDELFIDNISKVDTTSAYVWMPLSLYEEDGTKLDTASASILATPLDLRIYLDIGGGAYHVRQDYYKFLNSDYFKNFKKNENIDYMQVFDNDWYCFITKQKYLAEFTDAEIIADTHDAEKKLAEYDTNSKISWNRMLCGFILERGSISFAEIESKLNTVIKLYYCFEYYRQQIAGAKPISFKYDIGAVCKDIVRQRPAHLHAAILKGMK